MTHAIVAAAKTITLPLTTYMKRFWWVCCIIYYYYYYIIIIITIYTINITVIVAVIMESLS